MRLFLYCEEGFQKCILYTIIFDSISVQSLSEQKDFYVNCIVQTLQKQFLDFGGLFRLVQERWHHFRHLSQITLLSSLEMCLWQVRHVHPLFSFLWKFSSAANHPVWLKHFSTWWISIFSSRTVSGIALKSNRSSIDRSLELSIAATTLTLFVKHSNTTLSFSNGLSFEKGLGLLITPLCFFACGNPITVVSVPLGLPFFFVFGDILTSLKASRTSSWSQKFHQYIICKNSH